jgi:UDP:flavonoid glycosyltransferase YjiC (YdhE family)
MATMQAPLPNRVSLINYLFGKWMVEAYAWRLMGAMNNRFRRETLGLPPQTFREYRRALLSALIVQGFSPTAVPHPSDWPANVHTTGYWFLDEQPEWRAPQNLLDFLHAGEPPVYVGFGSMTGRDPGALTRIIVEAVTQSGQRAVLQSGWAGIGKMQLPSRMFRVDVASHRWLFRRVSAVVHHGGAGTTAEGLRAGVPAVIVPHMADQPFWGTRIAALGAGPRPIPRNKLTVARLADAIRKAVTNPKMRERAAGVGSKIRAEDGIGTAVTLIEAFLSRK